MVFLTLLFWLVLGALFVFVLPINKWLFAFSLLGWATVWGILFKSNAQNLVFVIFLLLVFYLGHYSYYTCSKLAG